MMKRKLTIVYILLSLLVCFGSARLSLPQVDSLGNIGSSARLSARYDEDSYNSNNNNRNRYSNSKNSLQVMITNKMRSKLSKDLGYLDDEIDDMEPQIAAVVIEKSLHRPKKGMPASWRRSDAGGGGWWRGRWQDRFLVVSETLGKVSNAVASGLGMSVDFVLEQAQRPTVQAVVLVIGLWIVRQPLLLASSAASQAFVSKLQDFLPQPRLSASSYQLAPQYSQQSLRSVLQGRARGADRDEDRGWLWRFLPFGQPGKGQGGLGREVDVGALSTARHLGFWDRLRMRQFRTEGNSF